MPMYGWHCHCGESYDTREEYEGHLAGEGLAGIDEGVDGGGPEQISIEELAKNGMIEAAIIVKPNCTVLVMPEKGEMTGWEVNWGGEATQTDARQIVRKIVAAEIGGPETGRQTRDRQG